MTRMMIWAFVFLLSSARRSSPNLRSEVSRCGHVIFLYRLAALIVERLLLRGHGAPLGREGRPTAAPSSSGSNQNGEKLVEALNLQADSDIEILACSTTVTIARARPPAPAPRNSARSRHRRIRPPHPHRSRAVRAADFGGDADPRHAEEAVGAAGRHPAFRHTNLFASAPRLFLSRQGADARRVRGAEPIGTW